MKKYLFILIGLFITLASFSQGSGSLGDPHRRTSRVSTDPIEGTTLTLTGTAVIGSTITFPTPFILGATAVTTTGTKFNYLTSATGTTGTATTNIVFSTSPTITTPTFITNLTLPNTKTITKTTGNGNSSTIDGSLAVGDTITGTSIKTNAKLRFAAITDTTIKSIGLSVIGTVLYFCNGTYYYPVVFSKNGATFTR